MECAVLRMTPEMQHREFSLDFGSPFAPVVKG
jgi:hypothetical protein